jgi:cytochrome c-type biogenesis protein CcmH
MPRSTLPSRVTVLALVVLTICAPQALAQSADPQTTLPDVEDEVMCPVCGTTLELASDSPQALDERDLIRDLIAEGLTKEEVKDELVSEFGPEVLAEPSTEGFDLAAWLVPGMAVLAGATLAFFAVRRWRGASVAHNATAAPLPGESDADRDRLDEDLKRYEL